MEYFIIFMEYKIRITEYPIYVVVFLYSSIDENKEIYAPDVTRRDNSFTSDFFLSSLQRRTIYRISDEVIH